MVPAGNIQVNLKVFDLKTGVVKNSRSATAFPMLDIVVELENALGKRSRKEEKIFGYNYWI